ncbi:hypothetical protein ABZX95_20505 [Streptomyces sp. NPDC004232]|uniref:hypothetical protein n=1 Tax=unclassified Streptomyces TaxID=2593676 RepID=UPI001DB811A1|nr:hypothetical protein [Streptomyces sp. tea 10]
MVDQGDVVVVAGPVDSAEYAHRVVRFLSIEGVAAGRSHEGARVSLMEGLMALHSIGRS